MNKCTNTNNEQTSPFYLSGIKPASLQHGSNYSIYFFLIQGKRWKRNMRWCLPFRVEIAVVLEWWTATGEWPPGTHSWERTTSAESFSGKQTKNSRARSGRVLKDTSYPRPWLSRDTPPARWWIMPKIPVNIFCWWKRATNWAVTNS